jgi:hypothetical protein
MGLLDDAIKEHLELKRKHGAAEEDLRRQETEALGPARRDFNAEPAAESGAAPAEAVAPVASDDAAGDYEPAAESAGWLDDEPFGAEEKAAPAKPAEPAAETPEPIEHAAEAVTPEPDPVRSQTPTEGFPAVSRDDEPPAESGDDDDVLEETPEFLQDTPEHDRLWFEQKPPRDFDFDG